MRLWLAVGVAAAAAFVVAGASGGSGTNTIMMFVNTRADPGNSVRAASGELDFLPEFLTDPQADKSLNSMTDAVATPAISAHDVIVGEGDGIVDLPVTLSAPSSSTVSVNYATSNSSAAASTGCPADYRSAVGTLEFAPNMTTMVAHVEIFDCNDVEGLQSFTLELSGASGDATIGRASGRVGISSTATTSRGCSRSRSSSVVRLVTRRSAERAGVWGSWITMRWWRRRGCSCVMRWLMRRTVRRGSLFCWAGRLVWL